MATSVANTWESIVLCADSDVERPAASSRDEGRRQIAHACLDSEPGLGQRYRQQRRCLDFFIPQLRVGMDPVA